MCGLSSLISPATYTISNEDLEKTCAMLKKDIIGSNVSIQTPFGKRRIVYTDFTATGRSLSLIQKFLTFQVLPYYANTHTVSNVTAGQTTHFRSEARRIIKKYLNAIEKHALIFTGAGSTSAFHKFLTLMEKSEWNIPTSYSTDAGISYRNRYYTESLRGAFFCDLCSFGFKNIAAYEEHTLSDKHQKAQAEYTKKLSTTVKERRIVIICDPTAHHSNLLPFREIVASWSKSGPSHVSLELVELKMKSETCTLCLKELREELIKIRNSSTSTCLSIPIVFLSAVSNVTGVCLNLYAINKLIHLYGGLACWDFSSLASHGRIDFAGLKDPHSSADSSIDVGFFSTHKFLGGPGSSGFLVLKKTLLSNSVPSCVGGGVVFFVSKDSQVYIKDKEEREEAGTPNILGDIQAGLVYQLHSLIPANLILLRERQFSVFLRKSWIHHSKIILLGPQDLDIDARFDHEEIESQTCIITFLIRYGNTTETCFNKGLFLHHGFVVKLLNDLFGIQARGGCACAGPLAHHLLGLQQGQVKEIQTCLTFSGHEILRPGFVRISLHFTMSWEEIQMIDKAVKFIADYGWMFLPLYTFSAESGEWYHRFFTKQDTEQRSWLAELNLKDIIANYVEDIENEDGIDNVRDPMNNKDMFDSTSQEEKNNKMKPCSWDNECPITKYLATSHLHKSQENSQIPAIHALIEENGTILKSLYSNESRQALSIAVDNIPVFRKEWIRLIWFALPADAAFSLLNGKECCLIPHFPLDSSRPQHSWFLPQSNSFAKSWSNSLVEETDVGTTGITHRIKESDPEARPLISDGLQLMLTPSKVVLDYLTIPRKIRRKLGEALRDFNMIQKGDRLLVGLSGGKDSLTLLHVLRDLQRRSPVPFSLAAATVDPQTPEYDPKPLEQYLESLGIKYHFLSVPIIKLAKKHMQRQSICAFCSRMKRGILYNCMKKNGYNVLALGQHLDDIAESFIMSAFQNGRLNTMKAHYITKNITIRVCRPLVYVREKALAEFAEINRLPVITENCPGCFASPTERHRAKLLLLQEEYKNPSLFQNLLKTLKPLLSIGTCETSLNEMHHIPLIHSETTDEAEECEGDVSACCSITKC